VALALYYSIVHSFLEEYYWRWFAFRLLRRFVATVPAVAVQGAAFAAHHLLVLGIFFGWNSPLAWFAAGSVAVGGAFWAGLYERSGRLRIAWCSHTLIDLGLFAMGYSMIFR
jgi:membrane protease YdiL (CAAX protease family)